MQNKLPIIYKSQYGRTKGASRNYALLCLPYPVSGPAFEKYGDSCVGAYVVQELPEEYTPFGPICLAIWPDYDSFEAGNPASAIIEMGQLMAKNDPTLKKTWVRLGVSLYMKDEEVKPIMNGDTETLREILQDGRGVPDGDSYIPSVVVEEFNQKYGTKFDGEPEFCM